MKTITWREIPMVKIAIPFIGGIIFPLHPATIKFLPVLYPILLIIISFPLRQNMRWMASLSLSLLLYISPSILISDQELLNCKDRDTIYFLAKIEKVDSTEKFKNLTINTILLKPNTWRNSEIKGLLKLKTWKGNFDEGDIIAGFGKIKKLHRSKGSKEFNYESYLKNQGYKFLIYTNPESLAHIEKGKPYSSKFYTLRKKLLNSLDVNISSKNEREVAKSIILGEKKYLPKDLRDSYKKAGAMHILAVSGLHVGICFLLVTYLFKLLKTNNLYLKYTWFLLKISAIFFYVLMTGSSLSAVRASTMFTLYLFGSEFNLQQNGNNTLAGAAIFILIFDQQAIFDPGFQFSFAALFGILNFFPLLKNLIIPPNKFIAHFWDITLMGITAQLGLLPLLYFYTDQFPVYFLITGILVMDLVFIILICGIVFLSLEFILPFNGNLLTLLRYPTKVLNEIIIKISNLPNSTIPIFKKEPIEVMLLYAIAILLLLIIHNPSKKRYKLGIYFIVSILILNTLYSIYPQ